MRRLWLLFAQTVTVCLGILFIVTSLRPDWLPRTQSPVDPAHAGSYAAAVAAAAPSVVRIYTSKQIQTPRFLQAPDLAPWFGAWPGLPQRRQSTSLGSGVIVRADGHILTNHHVIEAADAIEVALHDGRQARATLVGADPESDLAVLKIDLPVLPAMALADDTSLRVGDVVLAIGNPFGVGQTTTLGIVSALGRSRLGINLYENFIQTDAAINPGNSGGALIDTQGRMVGINTAIYSETGGSLGIGFAIPARMATRVLDQIIMHGAVIRGWLGIEPQNINAERARAWRLARPEGVLIVGVLPNGPAGIAGVRVGDVVLRLNGEDVYDTVDLLNRIAPLTPGSTAVLHVLRNGTPYEVPVLVGRRPQG